MRSSITATELRKRTIRFIGIIALLIVLVGALAACQSDEADAPAEEAPVEAPAEAEAPAEEEAAEDAEAEATAPAEEEAAEDPEAEATAPAEEEAAAEDAEAEAEATAPAEEEAAEETEAEATPPAEEEAGEEEAAAMDDAVAMGGYIVTITGGCGCHMNRDVGGLAGGNEFETPGGLIYASNITPDEETGIGTWSEEEIAAALQRGVTPDGHQLSPAMPYMRFSALSDQEALAVGAYLLSLDPVTNAVEHGDQHDEPEPYTPANEPPAEPPTDAVARGEQLVTIANCGGCHTPRDQEDMLLAGNMLREEFASNLTPDEETGIGSWSEEEIATFLQTGTHPDGSQVEGAMAQQIDRRFSTLTDEDAAAIAAYLKSIPAVENSAPEE